MGAQCTRPLAGDAEPLDTNFFIKHDRVSHERSSMSRVVDAIDDHESSTAHLRVKSIHGTTTTFASSFAAPGEIPPALLAEHYQPYEFPICPVINSETQQLVRSSWSRIVQTEYDCADTQSGKISGHAFFYNHFFSQLFKRLNDFSRIFPDIRSRADIFSKVMAFCISIRVEEIELVRCKLVHLGRMHQSIIHHPYLFGIYASNIHSTLRYCLGEHATQEVMSAWLHLLAFILRGMLPAYFDKLRFAGHYEGAVNAVAAISEKAHEEVRSSNEIRSLKVKLRSTNQTEPMSRTESVSHKVAPHDAEPALAQQARLHAVNERTTSLTGRVNTNE